MPDRQGMGLPGPIVRWHTTSFGKDRSEDGPGLLLP